ncbi:uncharacterized protein LOC131317613 [Rhododendron vialii]|uniref:uncharacterized protein LOC131317613 n=1 Tax=Rhododendron vialii TaxID=182163 RepID=UPI002660075F|nr:uncharacterized protein LOC131317613 [Rhododendron vialii]
MEDMVKTARLYYSKSSPDIKQAAHNFFTSLDNNNDGKVSLHEFLWFMRQKGHTKMSNCHFRSGCDKFIPGMYFACKKCFENGHNSFCVCPKCFEEELFLHEHVQFLDNYALLEARRMQGIATYSNQHKPSSSVTITELDPTSTTNAVVRYERPKPKLGHFAYKAAEIGLNVFNTALNASSWLSCTIM